MPVDAGGSAPVRPEGQGAYPMITSSGSKPNKDAAPTRGISPCPSGLILTHMSGRLNEVSRTGDFHNREAAPTVLPRSRHQSSGQLPTPRPVPGAAPSTAWTGSTWAPHVNVPLTTPVTTVPAKTAGSLPPDGPPPCQVQVSFVE